ncbi:DeoR/GlpR family DNA-binding transcription regulator [Acidicapsa ligni]|uniref:DeoR/GlpR family DNA-binding transcription regulator n=1 Tax=Acidicapsa ligni TaxID=542300 RepID=UPI0021DFD177|nr:DeoR/GlpR family DNA-binding transcription regulator [Acidicapsa ligni]
MPTQLNDRVEKIMKFLLRTGTASIEEILAEVGSSAPSIRRDLVFLENRGLIRRTHGGATLLEPLLYEPFRYDRFFQAREQRFANEKRRIGLAAAEMIEEHETIGLTAGTTATSVGRSLRHRNHIQVVTNAINIGMELCNQPGIRTYLTGGTISWEWSFSLAGNAALNFLNDVYMDKVFLSVIGLDVERGATTLETDEALVFRKMLKQSKQVIVVADSSKLGEVSPAFICPISEVHTLITDTGATDETVAAFTNRGVKVVRV